MHKTPDPCSQFYPGAKPFSSFEAQALRRYFNTLSDSSINLAIHLHASFVPRKVKINIYLHYIQFDCDGGQISLRVGTVRTKSELAQSQNLPFLDYADVCVIDHLLDKVQRLQNL